VTVSAWSDRKKAGRAWHPDRLVEMLGLVERFREYERVLAQYPDPGGDLRRLKDAFWSTTREALECVPIKRGQACGTKLGKRSNAMLKLEKGDVEAADRLAKLSGLTFEECLKIYSDLNVMNTPSYLGGELIEKGSDTTPRERRRLEKAAMEYA
jgi:hypothetical protein